MNLSLRQNLEHAPRTVALVYRSAPRATVALGGLTLAMSGLPLLVAFAGKRIVDAVVARDHALTLHWVLLELLFVALMALGTRGLVLVRQLLGARLAVDVNSRILEKALTLELRHFEDPEFYDQLTRARREASSRPLSLVTEIFGVIQNLLTLGGYAALLMGYSPWAVLGLLAAAFPATLSEIRFSNLAFQLRNWRAPETRKLNYLEYVLANDGHVKEVKLLGLGKELLARYKELGEKLYREDAALAVRRARWAYALSLLGTGAFYGCYAAMALAAAAGGITLGELTLYVVAFRQGQTAFQSVLSGLGGLYEHNLYMSNLFSYLAIPVGEVLPAPALPAAVEEGIRFESVSFRYPGQERFALENVSLFLPRGQSLALVGENGAGKTTFIKLLGRLYEPTEGRILLDGRDLRSWEPEELRRRIAVVFQDFNRYQLAARENVGFGDVEHTSDELRLRRAVESGGAREVIEDIGGLDTPLGRWFNGGKELSGGQWQKVALSRGFMREEADILVLDEPTAALDARAEAAVFERFHELTKGRTAILISHRFPTVRGADRIVVLENGRIVESGTHDELLASPTRYARLFELQAAGYR